MNLVVSDPKTKKAYIKKIDNPKPFIGKKIGEEIELGLFGLEGYKAKITGGSDKQGFPLRPDLEGSNRKKIYIVTNAKHGIRKKVSKRGNLISEEISQINLKVIKEGSKKLAELLGGEVAKTPEEELSFTERAVKESLANVGSVPIAPPTKKARH
ncbi:MAG: 30S ribosomal protein S6e [archaeon]|nr:30S ribosomal protein S6e [archaeon]